jgi:hypothetical protein
MVIMSYIPESDVGVGSVVVVGSGVGVVGLGVVVEATIISKIYHICTIAQSNTM